MFYRKLRRCNQNERSNWNGLFRTPPPPLYTRLAISQLHLAKENEVFGVKWPDFQIDDRQ